MEISELKQAYRIPAAWRDLGLPGEPGKNCRSPFPNDHKNGDSRPSFSVFDDGRHAKNFATGENFDVFDFIRKARGCDILEAIRFVRDRLGIPTPQNFPGKSAGKIPPLRRGEESELRELAERRNFDPDALRLAGQRGFLWFASLWSHNAWCLTDPRRAVYEFR